jgi:hypothetical protein
MAGSNLLAGDPGRHKVGRIVVRDPGRVGDEGQRAARRRGRAGRGDSKTIIVQFDVEKALALYAVREGKSQSGDHSGTARFLFLRAPAHRRIRAGPVKSTPQGIAPRADRRGRPTCQGR